jgi:hydroxylamine reductase
VREGCGRGVKGITVGPNPPAFFSPNVLKLLQEKYDLRVIGQDARADLATAMGR